MSRISQLPMLNTNSTKIIMLEISTHDAMFVLMLVSIIKHKVRDLVVGNMSCCETMICQPDLTPSLKQCSTLAV